MLAAFLVLSSSCAHQYTKPGDEGAVFRPVVPHDAAGIIQEHQNLQIVDTRTGWERSGGWIANSVHISYFTFLFGGGYDKLHKGLPVLLICAHGTRSYRVGRSLIKRGWKEVYDLEGGMKAWLSEGFPIITEHEIIPVDNPVPQSP